MKLLKPLICSITLSLMWAGFVQAQVDEQFSRFIGDFKEQAALYEADNDWHSALARWEIIKELDPTDEEAQQRFAEIEQFIFDRGEEQIALGNELQAEGRTWPAFKAYVKALSFNPNHKDALRYVKRDLNSREYVEYIVNPGDTLETIAEAEYGDPKKASLLSYVNGMVEGAKPTAGATIKAPILLGVLTEKEQLLIPDTAKSVVKSTTSVAGTDVKTTESPTGEQPGDAAIAAVAQQQATEITEEELAYQNIESLIEQGDYDAAIVASEAAIAQYSSLASNSYLNEAYFQKGIALRQKKDLPGALDAFDMVDPSYGNLIEVVSDLELQISEEANRRYSAGVQYFVNQDIDNAIAEFQSALSLNPDHIRARKDLRNAEDFKKKLEIFQ